MNREKALTSFKSYTDLYNSSDIKIKLKIDHTYRVANIAERIGKSVGANPDFSWFLGLLHDIGRFEQVKRYDSFLDYLTIDHAELGADILFKGESGNPPLICNYAEEEPDGFPKGWIEIAETAIRLHNKLVLPDSVSGDTFMYANILRDADKADIFRVIAEIPYEERSTGMKNVQGLTKARDDIMECVKEHRCVPRASERTPFESHISHCCMAFELVYPKTVSIVRGQRYLEKMLNMEGQVFGADCGEEQMAMVRTEIDKEWKCRFGL